ncbi:MAG: hypothetical protein E5X48_02950 [Mesorhizobium sp.]|uniref:hypothetical protein n=1 Tax=Mesorhizobium sp. TaxID=1871066 RepID=UPI00122B64CA|nr:hypothetical protein [Mesorhizobium sp.]TIQ37982.1 MAG: hypothetical protein E5X48_02950 [Mesorhizobium sp.]
MPNTTSLGTSVAVLRKRGRAASAIIYNDAPYTHARTVHLAKPRVMKIAVDDNEADVPAGALGAKSVYADPVGQRRT